MALLTRYFEACAVVVNVFVVIFDIITSLASISSLHPKHISLPDAKYFPVGKKLRID